jgi:DNA primase
MVDAVYDLIVAKKLEFKVSGRDYLIRCLNPEHDDSSPSLHIDKVTGIGHCFSCGFKLNLFSYYGLNSNPIAIRIAKLKEKLNHIMTEANGVAQIDGATPYTQSFRGISAHTLKRFGAFTTNLVEELSDRVIFPIKDITGKTRVYIARHLLSDANPRYVVFPKNIQVPTYPVVFEKRTNYIVLVEGIFDMLNVHDKGMHSAVCVFGTHTLGKDMKQKLLPYKAQGISHIFIMFDGDNPGAKAAEYLKPLLEEQEFITEIIELEEGTDPGDMSLEDVEMMKEYLDGKSSTSR